MIAAAVARLDRATVHVMLEDVSRADTASIKVAEVIIRDVQHTSGSDTIVRFTLQRDLAVDQRADYAVRVWVDSDGDGVPGKGDLHSDERHPVLTRGFGRRAEIVLGRSGGGRPRS